MTLERIRSETGFYHVILKGNSGQWLFDCDRDRKFFLALLRDVKISCDQRIHAWCLMGNHVHLIIEDPYNKLSDAMYRLLMYYAKAFNYVRKREGAVFTRHYWCEAIEDESYLITAMNYIHRNPEAAGICALDEYRWSSYRTYARGYSDLADRKNVSANPKTTTEEIDDMTNDIENDASQLEEQDTKSLEPLTNTKLLLDLVGGLDGFLALSQNHAPTAKPFPGSRLKGHLTYQELKRIANELVGPDTLLNLKRQSPSDRGPIVQKLYNHGFGPSQIRRLTGLSYSQIRTTLAKNLLTGE